MIQQCGVCDRVLAVEAFSRNSRRENGLDYLCRDCKSARYRARRAAGWREPVRTEEQRHSNAARSRAWRTAHRERARQLVQRNWTEKREQYLAQKRQKRSENKDAINARNRANRNDVVRAQKREWARRNKASVAATNRRRYERDPAHFKAKAKAWTDANPERNRLNKALNQHTRRAAGEVTAKQWREILFFYGLACAQCHTPASDRPLTIDHFIPITKGGTHDWTNVWPLCLTCNQRKHTRLPDIAEPPHVARMRALA